MQEKKIYNIDIGYTMCNNSIQGVVMKKAYQVRLDEDVVNKIKEHTDKYTSFVRESVNLRVDPKRERTYFFKKHKGICYYCGECVSGKYEIDHVIPTVMGGASEESNLVLSCVECNQKKKDFNCFDEEEITKTENIKYFGKDIAILNDGYFETSTVESIIFSELFKRRENISSLLTFAQFSKTTKASCIFSSCFYHNIRPVKIINNMKCLHLFVLIEYCTSVLGAFRYLVYDEIMRKDIFRKNSSVFEKLPNNDAVRIGIKKALES
ncbi:MAG: HNH endonuclease [Alphaproteobacteria bacterium]|nr:HNH endonuclease [Alphaproteobacteria bacterium]